MPNRIITPEEFKLDVRKAAWKSANELSATVTNMRKQEIVDAIVRSFGFDNADDPAKRSQDYKGD